MKTLIVPVLLLVVLFIQSSNSQLPKFTATTVPAVSTAIEPQSQVKDSFRANLIKAIQTQRQAGKINAREAMKLRLACMSPAFVERAHELAVIQIACSGEESTAVPMDADGMIQVEGIDWDALLAFIEKLIPLILKLIAAFGV